MGIGVNICFVHNDKVQPVSFEIYGFAAHFNGIPVNECLFSLKDPTKNHKLHNYEDFAVFSADDKPV